MTETQYGLAKLREPFTGSQIGKLPKPVKKDDQDKGRCEAGSNARYSADGHFCGGWHSRSLHLDYVGHAALTDRFLDVDPNWSWEPVAFGPDGLPAFDKLGGMWIRLTVCGVTRLGYGDAQGKTGGNAIKEAIGDALRNAGMRFGAALDLWHRGDLREAQSTEDSPPRPGRSSVVEPPADDTGALRARIAEVGKAKKLTIKEIGDDFASWSEGKPIGTADAATLTRYLDSMNHAQVPA